jgi:hypothetical protein
MSRATTTQRLAAVAARPETTGRNERDRVEAMYARMQAPGVRDAMKASLAATPEELADAAVALVRNRR